MTEELGSRVGVCQVPVEIVTTFVPPLAQQALFIPGEVECPHVSLVDQGIIKLFFFGTVHLGTYNPLSQYHGLV